jgi:hypothetical protein
MGIDELIDRGADSAFERIRQKLDRVRRREKTLALISGLLRFFILVFTGIFFLVLLEAIFWFPSNVRCSVVAFFLASTLFMGGRWIGMPLWSLFFQPKQPSDDTLALEVGRSIPSVRDRLADAIQVYRNKKRDGNHTSEEIARSALIQVVSSIENQDWPAGIPLKNLARPVKTLLLLAVVCFSLVLISPFSIWQSADRWVHPFKLFVHPASFQIIVHPKDTVVFQGDAVLIRVDFAGKGFSPPVLVVEPDGEKPFSIFMSPPFEYQLQSIRKRTGYYVRSGKVRTENYMIEVKERPMVRILQLTLHPPAYSRLADVRQEPNTGDVEALAGTEVGVTVTTNKPVYQCKMVFEKGNPVELIVKNQVANGRFVVRSGDRYWMELADHAGEKNIDPIRYTIRLKPDAFPLVRVLSPGKTSDLDQNMVVSLVLEIEDDFGIQQSRLGYYTDRSGKSQVREADTAFFSLPIAGKQPSHSSIRHRWDLDFLRLRPEDVVTFFVEATDNDLVSGPKKSRSDFHALRFPSIEEIYREFEKEQEDQIRGLDDLFTEGRSFQETIREIGDDLKTGKEMEWEQKENVKEKADRQIEKASQLEKMVDRLDNLIDRMDKNNLLTEQTIQKYQELQALYQEMATTEWKEAMKKLQDAMDQVSNEDMRKALEKLQVSQEALMKSLERTISLLKRIRIEQKTDELVRVIQDMAKRQNEIDQTIEGKTQADNDIVVQEKSIEADSRSFQDEALKLRDDMKALNRMPLESMEKAIQSIQSPQLSDEAKSMAEELRNTDKSNAAQHGRQIEKQMRQVERNLTEMKRKMQNDQRDRIFGAMRDVSRGLLELSQEQESLQWQMEKGAFSKNASEEKQQSISDALDQKADTLYQLSNETFMVSPEMGKSLGEAKSAMQQSLDGMKNSDFVRSRNFQQKAVGAMNRSIIAILKGMDQMGQGSGSGMESFLLQLQGMGEEQAALNRRLADILGEGRMSLAEQAGMGRLAAEQASIKERLRQMMKDLGNRSDVAGNLDQLVKDMEQVVKELQERKAGRQTIQNQERILSRLLDAQRSLNSQDLSKKRQAKTAQDVVRRGPASAQDMTSKKLERIRKDILEATNEGYTKEYLDLIQEYFDALLMVEPR